MARTLTIVVLCLCLTVAFAADLRRLIAERASLTPQSAKPAGADGKGAGGDLDTANSWGYGWGGPWGGWGGGGFGYGGGWGPWGYGWGGPWGGYGGGGWW